MQNKPLSNKSALLILANFYLGFSFIYPLILTYFTLWIDPFATSLHQGSLFITYLFMIVSSIYLAFPLLKESYHNVKSWRTLLLGVVKAFFIIYLCNALFSMVASFLAQSSSSENQMQIANELSSHQLMTIFTALIYAPIVEEIVFRGVLFRNLRAKLSFGYAALISAFAFGLMHVFSALISGNISDIWYLLVYGGLGFIFCYLYEKEKTIYAPMLLHLLNNGIAILFMLLI